MFIARAYDIKMSAYFSTSGDCLTVSNADISLVQSGDSCRVLFCIIAQKCPYLKSQRDWNLEAVVTISDPACDNLRPCLHSPQNLLETMQTGIDCKSFIADVLNDVIERGTCVPSCGAKEEARRPNPQRVNSAYTTN